MVVRRDGPLMPTERQDWVGHTPMEFLLSRSCPVCAEFRRKGERLEWLYAIALRNLHYGQTDDREALRRSADDARAVAVCARE